ncbi:MAG: hypothetical protein KF853_13595 [Rhodocyclaceae bacterium]|nr:hypothetical protein [Rhodocyclaceae bacterium]
MSTTHRFTSLLPQHIESKYLFRILSFDYLVEWFETNKLPLLSPSLWEDPFEKALMKSVFPDDQQLEYQKGRMYGLCFSLDGISDALWRIYSPSQHGVRIKTTASQLAHVMSNSPELAAGQTYIGQVEYVGTKALMTHAQDIRSRLVATGDTSAVAETMLLKRQPFRHEREVRVLHLAKDSGTEQDLLYFEADPHTVIKSILIDPRAPEHRVRALTRHFMKLCGFNGRVAQSETYKVPKLKS